MSGSRTWMLYGANGYTGRLIAEEAVRRGEKPVLAGRRAEAVEELARQLGLPHRVFALEGDVARHLEGIGAVLHAAGPFSATSAPMLEACLAAQAHYLDITGEIAVFEACRARGKDGAARGVAILPGVGFDVVPSDCLAAMLAKELPGADVLELAIKFSGPASGGTSKTALEGAAKGGAIRVGGKIRRVPPAYATIEVPFRDKRRLAVSIPWGDVSTAYTSTKIPDITVYMSATRGAVTAMKLARPFMPLMNVGAVRGLVQRFIPKSGEGPSEEHRKTARSQLWGRVMKRSTGKQVSGTLITPEGYALTATTSVEAVRRLLADGSGRSGYLTPSLAFGADFITQFVGCDFKLD